MGLAVELVDLYCLVEGAGLAVPPRPVEEVALADFQRCVEVGLAGSQRFLEAAGSAVPQRFVEEAGSAGPAMVVEILLVGQNWFPRLLRNTHEGILD
jgi:NAD(P)-dependent dehydrogenase (short-subunit alcohol dehydrogenase family)